LASGIRKGASKSTQTLLPTTRVETLESPFSLDE